MSRRYVPGFAAGSVIIGVLSMAFGSSAALAGAKDYQFEAVDTHVSASATTVVAVRLIHLPDKQPVKGAVIIASKMEMPMEGMDAMVTSVALVSSPKPDEYRFKSNLADGGPWTLRVQAKLTGETEPLTGSVPFIAE